MSSPAPEWLHSSPSNAAEMDKACPVVIRPERQILAFQHPRAGLQLVKGGVEPNEHPAKAAERELSEESGLILSAIRDLGQRLAIEQTSFRATLGTSG